MARWFAIPAQRASSSNSLAQSEAAGQVGEPKQITIGPTGQPFDMRCPVNTRIASPLGLNMIDVGSDSWADAGAWPRLLERLGRRPGIAFTFALIVLEFQFPLVNAIEQGIVSAERDGCIVTVHASERNLRKQPQKNTDLHK